MGRETKRLNARSVTTVGPGRHADGDGLYLVVDTAGARRWQFHFRLGGKFRREMGLGNMASTSLAEAREKAAAARRLVAKGIDPISERIEVAKAMAVQRPTFGEFSDEMIATLSTGFRNEKHIWQWGATLTTYGAPLQKKRLDEIDTELVLQVLQPIWTTKSETASRLRGRIERILDAAKAKGFRDGENPARWRGHLDKLLPKRQQLTRGHHPAMPYAEVAGFLARLREAKGSGASALEFLVLTAARTGEVIGARWREIDFEATVWTVPPERMKAGREHRVPLVPSAVALLRQLHETRRSEFIFAGNRAHSSISNATMMKALRTLDDHGYTVHGFRSSFRDWAGEETNFAESTAEAALAHVVGDAVERAYRRGDALAKRRKLMEAWERYCLGQPKGHVISMSRNA